MPDTGRYIKRFTVGLAISAVVAGAALGALPANAATPRSAVVGTVTLPAGGYAYASVPAVAVDAGHNALYALVSGDHSSLSVVDLASNTVAKTIPLAKAVDDVALDAGRGLVYVTRTDVNAQTGSVLVFSTATKALVATIPLGAFLPTAGSGASGIGVDSVTGSIYLAGIATSGNTSGPRLKVLSAAQITTAIGGAAVTPTTVSLPFGDQVSVAVDSTAGVVYAASNDLSSPSLFVVSAATNSVTRTIPLAGMPATSAVDPSTGTVYVGQRTISNKTSVAVVPRGAASVAANITIPAQAQSLDVDPTAGRLYAAVAQPFEGGAVNELLTISTASRSIVTTTPLSTPADVAVNTATGTAYVSGAKSGNTTVSAVRTLGVDRVAGSDRYAIAVAVSKRQFPGTAHVVYIASGMIYPDALSAGPAAAHGDGPLLLTAPGALPPSVAAEVARLKPATIVVAGGPASVSDAVLTKLRATVPSATVARVAGADRYSTSRAVVSRAFATASTVYVASGANFPDALSAGGVAGANGVPVLLVNGAAGSVDSATAKVLSTLKAKSVVLVGGTGSLSPGVATSLTRAGYAVTRLAGPDRYSTAVAVNGKAYKHASTAIIASGTGFSDALSATSWAGTTASPLYLAPSNCVPRGVLSGLGRLGTGTVTLVGGTATLTAKVADLVPCTF
ncbi:cell wall-binding repeat-containing protein [Leifsonia poae]|uniref:Cell wall-binding repeat-containing protein n=1 Tax=Leifsonia poae TaxID=110933 RepID=A0A9W6HCP9_9MICO|nr:cell wall-binding repeat-containing protein [Leifsonia poae]GLJ77348.1 hypothetical protein GCM10017584_29220 [Leifsonia poae]